MSKIITVWYDETDEEGTPIIVDTDTVDGGESHTLKCFEEDDRDSAIAFAERAAEKRGIPLEIRL